MSVEFVPESEDVDSQLDDLLVALEAVNWNRVSTISALTAATFAQRVQAAKMEGRE